MTGQLPLNSGAEVAIYTARLTLVPLTTSMAVSIQGGGLPDIQWIEGFAPAHIPLEAYFRTRGRFAGVHLFRMKDSEVVMGCSRYEADESVPQAIWLEYKVAKPLQRRGYATEAVRALVEWLRAQPDVRSIRAYVHRHNDASKAVLRKIGFERVGGKFQELWVLNVIPSHV